GKEAIHPNKCMLFSENQYQTRHDWNRDSLGAFNKVPEPFDVKKLRQWTAIWSLTGDCFKYLPTAYCYYGHPESSECWADSNGTAAGNTLEEARLQGFMELVERDAVAVWWYNRLPKPPVDLDSFNDSYLDNLRDYYQSINRDLWVLDLTSDLGIPAFAAISSRLNMETEDLIYGFGAHFDARLGIMRAITELNQILPLVLLTDESGNTEYYCSDELANQWWKEATLDRYSYLAPSYLPAKKAADYPQMATEDLRLDIEKCVQITKNNGLETLVLNQTRPDIGLSVVKVVVPGLRHFWKRWEKGRLYDVPVKLGDLKAPYQEQQLNSFPIFL
ncbi:MAG: YcaO-like family protein, partial [Symploca sp. SIO1C4]|nr:YcaO-like family protein [Symploca sp. SIO1C4]